MEGHGGALDVYEGGDVGGDGTGEDIIGGPEEGAGNGDGVEGGEPAMGDLEGCQTVEGGLDGV